MTVGTPVRSQSVCFGSIEQSEYKVIGSLSEVTEKLRGKLAQEIIRSIERNDEKKKKRKKNRERRRERKEDKEKEEVEVVKRKKEVSVSSAAGRVNNKRFIHECLPLKLPV